MKHYDLERYDAHGYLKPSLWLMLGWLWVARAWVVLAVCGASSSMGSDILFIVYPEVFSFYLALGIGFPCLCLLWFAHLRYLKRIWIQAFFQLGWWISLIVVAADIGLTLYNAWQDNWQFHWLNALSILGLCWFWIYLISSTYVRHLFDSSSGVSGALK